MWGSLHGSFLCADVYGEIAAAMGYFGACEERKKRSLISVLLDFLYTETGRLMVAVTSLIKIIDSKIAGVDECWADYGIVVGWRLDKHIRNAVL